MPQITYRDPDSLLFRVVSTLCLGITAVVVGGTFVGWSIIGVTALLAH